MPRGDIDRTRLPCHVGVIMDGNGRWARKYGKARSQGHRAGADAISRLVKACHSLGIHNLTLFAFSIQNWGRPKDEVQTLMQLLGEFISTEWNEIMKNDVRVVHLGELKHLPREVRIKLRSLVFTSRHNRAMTLALALSYGGREEIIRAARNLLRRAINGKIKSGDVDEHLFSSLLYTKGLPDPDLIIRTGGEKRISNFLLWQSAYSEFYFTDVLWPEFQAEDLESAIWDFQQRHRRFGLTDEQVGNRAL